MEDIPIMIQHGGVWDSGNYVNYSVNGVVIHFGCKYDELVQVIAKHIGIRNGTNLIDIKYKVKEGYTPIEVVNDMSVRLYIELKRRNLEFTEIPLCIAMKEKNTGLCSSYAKPRGTLCDDYLGLDIPEMVCDETILMIGDGTYQNDVGVLSEGIISDPLNQEIEEGQLYQDKETLYAAMNHYAIRKNFQFMVKKSCSKRFCLECVSKSCSWYFKSSSLHNTELFKVTKFNSVHTCSIEDKLSRQRHATYGIIGSMISSKYDNPKSVYTPADIMHDMKKDYGLDITYMKAWRSKEKALEIMRGNPSGSYEKIPSYIYMLMHTNPGSVAKLHKSVDGCFLYVFVALYASIRGWEYCKPIVVVDGTFLKSAHRGVLIIACTQDADGKIFPLAYLVVDSENDASWEWFFERFRDAYGVREGMCIVSDRHESIAKATLTVYPEVPHCACIYHLCNNIKSRYKKSQKNIKNLFFAAARAYTIEEFEQHMHNINSIDKRVKEYLFSARYHRWSRAHSEVNRTIVMTSNIAESMNSVNKSARELPILPLLESIHSLVRDWNYKNNMNAMVTNTKLGKKYEDILTDNYIDSQMMTVKPSNEHIHTVYEEGIRYVVNLGNRTCSCKRFEMDEIPCPHALAIVTSKGMDPYEFCSIYYTKGYLIKTYEEYVHPIPSERNWNIPTDILEESVSPPVGKIQPGRPKKKRGLYVWERHAKKVKNTCKQCGHEGHNRRTCRNVPRRD